MSTESTGRLRASDSEREEYASIVREAVGEGRLSLAEGDERLAQIYAARHREDLRPLVTDLPRAHELAAAGGPRRGYGPGGFPPGYGWRGGPGSGPWGGPPADGTPVRRGPAVARHFGFVLVVAAALTGLWVISGAHFFWPAIPLTFLVIGLARRTFGLGWRRRW